jgi:hypothetical protein
LIFSYVLSELIKGGDYLPGVTVRFANLTPGCALKHLRCFYFLTEGLVEGLVPDKYSHPNKTGCCI